MFWILTFKLFLSIIFSMQLKRIAMYRQTFLGIKPSLTTFVTESNYERLFIRYYVMSTSEYNRIARNSFLLLIVYINCFCIPVFSCALGGYGRSLTNKRFFSGMERHSFFKRYSYFKEQKTLNPLIREVFIVKTVILSAKI